MFIFVVISNICHLHTNLKKGKEPEATAFWSDLGARPERKSLKKDVKKAEKSSVFNNAI